MSFIDNLRDGYEKTISRGQLPLFETFQKLSQFTLCDQKAGDILKAIDMLQAHHCDFAIGRGEPSNAIAPSSVTDLFSSDIGTSGQILVGHKDFMIEINDVFFNLKLRQYIDSKFDCGEKYDHLSDISNYNDFVSICVESTMAFQHFYKVTASMMIQQNFPTIMLQYLDQFVFDVKLRRANAEDFYRMYDDSLYNYVKIANEINEETESAEYEIVVEMLQNLKWKCLHRFVIVVTHFKRFSFLLGNSSLCNDDFNNSALGRRS